MVCTFVLRTLFQVTLYTLLPACFLLEFIKKLSLPILPAILIVAIIIIGKIGANLQVDNDPYIIVIQLLYWFLAWGSLVDRYSELSHA